MSARIRRRPDVERTAEREWQVVRDFEVARSVAGGLGQRPAGWWFFESDRPDLGQDSHSDPYSHLREPEHPLHRRAADRLRHLLATGELRPSEITSIRAGEGTRYGWRKAILDEVTE